MSDADDLARRYLALWSDYLTALLANPQAAELLQRWLAFGAAGGDGRPAAGAPAAAGASGERDDAVAELARRVGELERRVAALERGLAKPRRSGRGARG